MAPRPVAFAAIVLAAAALPSTAKAQEAPCVPSGSSLSVVTESNEFSENCLAAPADTAFELTLENKDPFAHNLSIYQEEGGEILFEGEYVSGDQTQTYQVDAIAEGTFYFRCDIHPFMEGTFVSGQGGGAAPSADPREGRAPEGPTVRLEKVVDGIVAPVFITAPPGDSERLFIVDQIGMIRVVRDGELLEAPFLDVSDKIVELNPDYDERGLLGLAFDPDFASNGRFYVYYSAPLRDSAPDDWNHTSHVAMFEVDDPQTDTADASTETVIFRQDEPQGNHNGGHIAFGPDGMLYIPLGDGGNANDVGLGHPPEGNGQDITTTLGAVLRLDVGSGTEYKVPEDNPFAGDTEGADEIFAYGFRNPYHLSFDRGGDRALLVADAGQDRFEEVSNVTKGGNYGWHIKEGSHCFDPESPSDPPSDCPSSGPNGEPLTDPVIEYSHEEIQSSVIVGGYVYRGPAMSSMQGWYVFGDYSRDRLKPQGILFGAAPADDGGFEQIQELGVQIGDERGDGELGRFVLSFGEDGDGELYVGVIEEGGPEGMTGAVYRFAGTVGEGGAPGGATGDGSGFPVWIVFVIVGALVLGASIWYLAKRTTQTSGSRPA